MRNENEKYPRIRNLREDADITQTEFAAILGVSQSAYSLYEAGKRDLPTETLIKIADFHNCSVDYLLGRSKNKHLLE